MSEEQAEYEFEETSPRVTLAILEEWLQHGAPEAWLDGYLYLRSQGIAYRDAMLATWLSLSTDDRGEVATREAFANLMGVARATTYQWEARRPEVRQWAEVLRVMRLRGAKLAEVDKASYAAAISATGTASDRKLYYQRAGVWEEDVNVRLRGDENEPVRYVDVTDDELDAIRQALAGQAEGGGP